MSDIDTVVVDSLKVLDPKRPIREADMARLAAGSTRSQMTRFGNRATLQRTIVCQPLSRNALMCTENVLGPANTDVIATGNLLDLASWTRAVIDEDGLSFA